MHANQTQTSFRGQLVVVTGAAQGIGVAIAEAFALRGADLALLDCQPHIADVAAQLTQRHSVHAQGYTIDIAQHDAVNTLIREIEHLQGPIEVLAHAAGILRVASALNTSQKDWNDTFAVNTHGVFNITTAVARSMQARRRGTIVTVGSNASSVPRTSMAAYAAAKAAAWQFVRCLGLELAADGIRCNNVSPGSTDTAMQRQLWRDGSGANAAIDGSPADYRLGIPLQRIATPHDIARAVCFLASSDARHITLHDLRVDGGATLDA